MSVRFVIDSASDILPREAEKLGVTHLAMKVVFGQEEYADGIDMSHEAFFAKLADARELPTTCQIPPSEFEEAYAPLVEQGHEVVVITISSGLSGTYQSAVIASEDYRGKVFVVDSQSAAIGERVLLMRGIELAQQGMSAEQIVRVLDEEKKRLRLMAVLDTLEYLKKGGRISAATALAGSLLSIKPAIEVRDGLVAMAGTARGTRKGNQLLKELIEKHGGVNFNKPVAFVYSGLNDDLLQKFIADCPELWGGRTDLPVYSLGCTIGTHVGPGAYGVAFIEE